MKYVYPHDRDLPERKKIAKQLDKMIAGSQKITVDLYADLDQDHLKRLREIEQELKGMRAKYFVGKL